MKYKEQTQREDKNQFKVPQPAPAVSKTPDPTISEAESEPASPTAIEFLRQHARRRPISFHMPGHKGRELYRTYGYSAFLEGIPDWDITEIPGADNLFQTEGILAETQRQYAEIYGVDNSYLLINGSSGGIIAAILASVREGGRLIMARNCHKSVFNALTLGNIQPAYIYPELLADWGILGRITPEEVKRAMDENPDADAVILPSPNYYGICSPVREIAREVHSRGKILIVDQAHGAHLKWLSKKEWGGTGPQCAEEGGADLIINSTHKTLASFTQSAVLNLNSRQVDRYVLEDKLQAIQSTSPSYLLMASLDVNRDLLQRHGRELMEQWNENLRYFYAKVRKIPGLTVLHSMNSLDHSKININTAGLGITAAQLEEQLMEREIFSELTTGNILMLMTGIGNRRRDFESLLSALWEIAETSQRKRCVDREMKPTPGSLPEAAEMETQIAMPGKKPLYPIPKQKQRVNLEYAEGRICAASIIPYPPGIPLICPGERLEKEDIQYIEGLRAAGEKVIGVNDENQVTVGI